MKTLDLCCDKTFFSFMFYFCIIIFNYACTANHFHSDMAGMENLMPKILLLCLIQKNASIFHMQVYSAA